MGFQLIQGKFTGKSFFCGKNPWVSGEDFPLNTLHFWDPHLPRLLELMRIPLRRLSRPRPRGKRSGRPSLGCRSGIILWRFIYYIPFVVVWDFLYFWCLAGRTGPTKVVPHTSLSWCNSNLTVGFMVGISIVCKPTL